MKNKLPLLFLFTGIVIILTSFLNVPIPGINIKDTYFVIAVFGVTFIFLLIYFAFALIYYLFQKKLNNWIGVTHYSMMTIAILLFRFSTLLESENPLICYEKSLFAKIQCYLNQIIIVVFFISIIIFFINIIFGMIRKKPSHTSI